MAAQQTIDDRVLEETIVHFTEDETTNNNDRLEFAARVEKWAILKAAGKNVDHIESLLEIDARSLGVHWDEVEEVATAAVSTLHRGGPSTTTAQSSASTGPSSSSVQAATSGGSRAFRHWVGVDFLPTLGVV